MLTPTEREALQKAVYPAYQEERGLLEGSHGEIVNERGRTVCEVGFTRAICKVLGDRNDGNCLPANAGLELHHDGTASFSR